jgi:dolichyl-phosphate beta-glucosyltransferase
MAFVSFIIPTLNEEHIDASLARLSDHLLRIEAKRFEILLVDDSSNEGREKLRASVERCRHLAPRVEVRVLEGARRGKGHAVKLGALASRGEFVFVVDADLPVPLEHIEEFLAMLEQGDCEVVIGERPMESDLAGRPLRLLLSRALFLLQYSIVFQRRAFADTQCGFKGFCGETIRSLANRQIVDGGMYDIEYLYMTLLDRREVRRVPVSREPETRPSKIRVWRCIYTDPIDLLRIKAHRLAGGYDDPQGPRVERAGTGVP